MGSQVIIGSLVIIESWFLGPLKVLGPAFPVYLSRDIKNKKNQKFIVSTRLKDTHDSLINEKPFKTPCVVNLNKMQNWEKLKSVSNQINKTFEDSYKSYRADHFAFGFKSRNLQDVLKLQLHFWTQTLKKLSSNVKQKVNNSNFKMKVLK